MPRTNPKRFAPDLGEMNPEKMSRMTQDERENYYAKRLQMLVEISHESIQDWNKAIRSGAEDMRLTRILAEITLEIERCKIRLAAIESAREPNLETENNQ